MANKEVQTNKQTREIKLQSLQYRNIDTFSI